MNKKNDLMPKAYFTIPEAYINDEQLIAIIDDHGRQISYQELSVKVDTVASELIRCGVKAEEKIAVFMERSIDLVVSMLAIFKAGGCYIPVDLSFPQEKVRDLLNISGAGRIIAKGAKSHNNLVGLEHHNVYDFHSLESSKSAGAVCTSKLVPPTAAAYVIFTSGSTGVPKGVTMSYQGLERLIAWQIADAKAALKTLQFTSLSFDVYFQEVLSTLLNGGTLYLVGDCIRKNSEELLTKLANEKVQRIFLPFIALSQLADAFNKTNILPSSLEHVITAGEKLVINEPIKAFFKALPNARLDNQFGPTEAHLITRYILADDRDTWDMFPSIGQAAEGVTTYILDDNLDKVKKGEIGELYVSGSGLARGYLDNPKQTSHMFLPNPFADCNESRMYRTGDLVRKAQDGNLIFEGRADTQLKIRGFRVEAEEVEYVLCAHPKIEQAIVGLKKVSDNLEVLAAYIITENEISNSEVQAFVSKTLPDYMIPKRVHTVEQYPLTASGKVDRIKLKTDFEHVSEEATGPSQKASIEGIVKEVWERVLGHDEFEDDDDFFDVGGDSLLVAWAVRELERELDCAVELSIFLEASSITEIADVLRNQAIGQGAKASSEVVSLRPGPMDNILFFIHPLGGEVYPYRNIANAFTNPMRVLGLRRTPTGVSEEPVTIQSIATKHVESIKLAKPCGPYLIAGWSFGGVIAYEIAQQLISGGDEVRYLGLIDSNPVLDIFSANKTSDSTLSDSLEKVLNKLNSLSEAQFKAKAVRDLTTEESVAVLLCQTLPTGITLDKTRQLISDMLGDVRAAKQYQVKPYAGEVDLYQSDTPSTTVKKKLAEALETLCAGTVQSHNLYGDHYALLKMPCAQELAQAVEQSIIQIA
ncbi:hypothetical protein JL49_16520 [Pseudoalteromonas luteoviolacea]|nr:hypothetical protein JL49_16520 [Pseudoalteromonas luteoviolacea]